MMSHENRKAVVQLVRDLAAKGLNIHFQLQTLSGYDDKKFRKRVFLQVSTPTSSWTFVSRNYKTNETSNCDAYEQPYIATKIKHGLFEEREAKSLLKDIAGTVKSTNKILSSTDPSLLAQNPIALLFDEISNMINPFEALILKAEIACITDEEAENFGVKEDVRCH